MGKRILFVEEDAGFRRVFTHAMREALGDEGLGVAFAEAGSLAEARSRLREGGLDAALIDVTSWRWRRERGGRSPSWLRCVRPRTR
jgi:CheY-like chemotaxis protein